ncbi:MAG: DUF962 domain-containing protein [Bdellovibrionales bacterium]
MRSLEQWLDGYAKDHQDRRNQLIHKACVPAIFFTIFAAVKEIPISMGSLYLGEVIIVLVLLWYAFLSWKAFLVMMAQVAAMWWISDQLKDWSGPWYLGVLAALFILAWIGQFWGHHLEGRRPSFFNDLLFLLIGPLWVWLGHRSKEIKQ